jgi:thiamine-phosphate pyrophosphorylase
MRLVLPRLYVILDAALTGARMAEDARMLTEEGVRLIQYRSKTATAREQLAVCRQLAEIFQSTQTTFIVNDRPDVAVLCGAGGVHVGQDDLSVEDARSVAGDQLWVGVSTHNLEQVRRAAESSADYVAVGPIYATETKANPDPVVGTELIRQARRETEKPLVAIGGITLERAGEVMEAGADAVVVIADIWKAPEARERVRQYQKLLGRN